MSEGNKAIVSRSVEEVWNKGNLDLIDEFYADNYVGHGTAGQDEDGPEALKQGITNVRTAYPDLHLTIEDLIAEGDKVVGLWTATGTNTGTRMDGGPATGKRVTVSGITINRIYGGKIVESWARWDSLSMYKQLGVTPPME